MVNIVKINSEYLVHVIFYSFLMLVMTPIWLYLLLTFQFVVLAIYHLIGNIIFLLFWRTTEKVKLLELEDDEFELYIVFSLGWPVSSVMMVIGLLFYLSTWISQKLKKKAPNVMEITTNE